LNNFVIENSIKSKSKALEKLGHILGTVGKSLNGVRVYVDDFTIFTPKM